MSSILKYLNQHDYDWTNYVNLIASENYISDDVKKALQCNLVNKYAEGYPNKRYYGGCGVADEVELYCQYIWQKVFSTDYYVNVQPHSGSQANMAVYQGLLKPGDTILSMSLDNGGHLTHGSPVNFSGKLYNIVNYGLTENGFIDLKDFTSKIIEYNPKLIIAGASAYSRNILFSRMKEIIDTFSNGAYFMVDMSHIAGLVVTGIHESPFGVADIITSTTHKTLRGPRGGIIFSKTEEISKKINSAVFPGIQGGPHMNVIAAKAVCAEEALTLDFKNYMEETVKSSKLMAKTFIANDCKVLTNGTDNHLFIVDFSDTHPNLSGKKVQEYLENEMGILVNRNTVPGDKRPPMQTSGIRIGTAAMVTRGYKAKDFVEVAKDICSRLNCIN